MATAKTTKTTTGTNKTATKATVTPVEKVENKVDITEESKAVEVSTKIIEEEKKTFTDSDYILCRSVCSGSLFVTSQSGNLYRFRDYGSECEINYRDLVTLVRNGSGHVFDPDFVILDEDFLDLFPTVKKKYGEMYTMSDLTNILELPISQMSKEIAKLPKATLSNMRNLIATQIANGKLDSIAKVRELSTIFDSDFNLLSELFVK